MTNNNEDAKRGRRRGVGLVLLVWLLLVLGTTAYALSSSSPSAPTSSKDKPSGTPTASVLAPEAPRTGSTSGSSSTSSSSGSTQLVLAPAASTTGSNGNCVQPSNGQGNCDKVFGVTVGPTQTLYPGIARTLPVTYSNPNAFDILVTSYKVSVASNKASCQASNLQVPAGTVTPSQPIAVAGKGLTNTSFPIKLGANAPDACQNVSFTITVNASAVKK